ncbi:MAG TPA: recombinase RecB, partial [Mycobacterium sp.]|nr:recombinase RecB [Mycobacterium sp.]
PHQQHCPLNGGTPPPYPGWPENARAQVASHPSESAE